MESLQQLVAQFLAEEMDDEEFVFNYLWGYYSKEEPFDEVTNQIAHLCRMLPVKGQLRHQVEQLQKKFPLRQQATTFDVHYSVK